MFDAARWRRRQHQPKDLAAATETYRARAARSALMLANADYGYGRTGRRPPDGPHRDEYLAIAAVLLAH